VSALVRTPRALAVALAGVLATACGAPGSRAAVRTTSIATIEVAPVAVTTVTSIGEDEPEPSTVEPTGPTIVIERAHDPNRVAPGSAALVGSTVQRALGRAGFTTMSRAESSPSVDAAFIVTPTVHALKVSREGSRTTISCSITLRISSWSQKDQVERWEAYSTAAAMGKARATTSSAPAQVELGIRDCLEGAVRAAAAREVIPFLRRVTLESRNVSGSSLDTEL